MRCRICTGTISKSASWFISPTWRIQTLTTTILKVYQSWKMFKITSLITRPMTIYLSSMCWPCTKSILMVRDVNPKNTLCGVMGVLHSSKVHKHGTLFPGIHILLFVNKGMRGVNVLELFFIWSWVGWGWWCKCILEMRDSQGTNHTPIDETARCPWHYHFLLATSRHVQNHMIAFICFLYHQSQFYNNGMQNHKQIATIHMIRLF